MGISFFWQVINREYNLPISFSIIIYSIIQVIDEFSYLPQYIFFKKFKIPMILYIYYIPFTLCFVMSYVHGWGTLQGRTW
jgi:hypothetical protein